MVRYTLTLATHLSIGCHASFISQQEVQSLNRFLVKSRTSVNGCAELAFCIQIIAVILSMLPNINFRTSPFSSSSSIKAFNCCCLFSACDWYAIGLQIASANAATDEKTAINEWSWSNIRNSKTWIIRMSTRMHQNYFLTLRKLEKLDTTDRYWNISSGGEVRFANGRLQLPIVHAF